VSTTAGATRSRQSATPPFARATSPGKLLAFSRRQILQTQEIDLREVVQEMDTLLKRLLGEDVRLLTLRGAEPVIVRADKTQLEQVVMNLAVNRARRDARRRDAHGDGSDRRGYGDPCGGR